MPARRTWRRSGFTLIELLVVIVIMSILAVVVVPRVLDRPDQARVARAKQDVAALENALKFYRIDNLVYPSTEHGLKSLSEKPTTAPIPANWAVGGYIDRVPNDPWGNSYQYLLPGLHGEFDIFSFGSDGKPGGEGVASDIGNWTLN